MKKTLRKCLLPQRPFFEIYQILLQKLLKSTINNLYQSQNRALASKFGTKDTSKPTFHRFEIFQIE